MTTENTKQIAVTVQIGNSDDKLRQSRWAMFIMDTLNAVADFGGLHFSGGSRPEAHWQNYCFVVVGLEAKLPKLKNDLRGLAAAYNQDSIAIIVGQTEFVRL